MAKMKNLDDLSSQIWKGIEDLKLQIPALVKRINEVDIKIPEEVKALESSKRSIDRLKAKFRNYETIYNDIVSKTGIILSCKQEADKMLEELKTTKSNIKAIAEEADTIKEAIDENEDIVEDIKTMNEQLADVSNAHDEVEKHRAEIKKMHRAIFGYSTKNNETGEITTIKGLKDELDTAYEALKTNIAKIEKETQEKYNGRISEWEKRYTGLKGQIESLLPGAMQAGLAHAYQVKRRTEEQRLREAYRKFGWTIFYMVSTAAIQLGIVIWWFTQDKDLSFIFSNMPAITIGLLPIFGALIWIGVYQNKSLNLTKKLIEEYFHKEATSRTFEGLSKQITELGNNKLSASLKGKLLEQTLDATAKNPSECITNHEKSDNPIFSILNSSSKWVKKLGGAENVAKLFTTIAEIYNEQGKKDTTGKTTEASDD